ncbi:DUF1993 domain-containing protein [Caulobacter sp. 73W]|uniref:DUF1993 domain-containing protein n=1 Tax=Caulobacter sp. 73W TaxID=3161137 RepID=A0AB39KW67_9CAUL
MNLYALAVPTFSQMLRALAGQLDKGASFGGDALAGARLAPDMFPLSDQVRYACYQAADAVARLSGPTPAPRVEIEPTFDALKARVAETLALLAATPEQAFDGADDRAIELVLPNGMILDITGEQYLRDWALPQFYFHLNSAYAVMRQAGVTLGKADYVPHALAYVRPGTLPDA